MRLSLTTQAGLLATSRAVGQILNALFGIILVRHLSQADFGTFRQVYLLYATLIMVTDLGLTESLYYFIPRQPQRRSGLVVRSVAIVGALQILVGVLLVFWKPAVGSFFNNPDLPALMKLLAAYVGLSVVTRIWEVQLISEQRIALVSLVTGGFEFLKVGLMFLALRYFPGIEALLWALVLGTGLKLLAHFWCLARDYGRTAFQVVPVPAKEQLGYALTLWMPGILNVLGMQVHQYIVGHSFSPAEYALYSVACFQVPLLGVLSNSILEITLVRVTEAHAQERHDVVLGLWDLTCRKSLLLFIPIAVGLSVLSVPLITLLFTKQYAAAAPLFAVLMVGLPLTVISTNNILRAYGAMKDYAKFYASRMLLGIALGVAGVHWLGMWGAAISYVLTVYIITGWQLVRVAQILQIAFARVLPWRWAGVVLLASGLAALPGGACALFFSRPLAGLGCGLALFTVSYVFLAVRLHVLRWEEIVNPLKETRAGISRLLLERA